MMLHAWIPASGVQSNGRLVCYASLINRRSFVPHGTILWYFTFTHEQLAALRASLFLQVETFMLEALEDVKRQITNYRQAEYRKAVAEYNQRLRDGSPDKGHLPNIRWAVAIKPRAM